MRTSKSVGFLNDERRLNVAFSRAKEGRYVFGHFKALNESNSRLPSLLQDIQSHGSVINYEELASLGVMPASRR